MDLRAQSSAVSLTEKRIALIQRAACAVCAQFGQCIVTPKVPHVKNKTKNKNKQKTTIPPPKKKKININASRYFVENNNVTVNRDKERDEVTKRVRKANNFVLFHRKLQHIH